MHARDVDLDDLGRRHGGGGGIGADAIGGGSAGSIDRTCARLQPDAYWYATAHHHRQTLGATAFANRRTRCARRHRLLVRHAVANERSAQCGADPRRLKHAQLDGGARSGAQGEETQLSTAPFHSRGRRAQGARNGATRTAARRAARPTSTYNEARPALAQCVDLAPLARRGVLGPKARGDGVLKRHWHRAFEPAQLEATPAPIGGAQQRPVGRG